MSGSFPLRQSLGRLLLGCVVGAAVLAGVEGAARVVWGAPAPLPQVIQVSVARLLPDGDTLRLTHAADRRQDVVVPPKGDRPRVVTLGGSSVRHAWGADPRVNFPTWLAEELPEVDVVNLGSPGQTTLGLRANLPALAAAEPDLIVVYAGHNDFSQPVFQGQIGATRLWTLPLFRLASQSWIYATLRRPTVGLLPPAPDQRRGLLVTNDSRGRDWQDATLARFARNLEAMVAEAPAPVLLTTQLRNFEFPPTGLLTPRSNEACRRLAPTLPLRRMQQPAQLAAQLDQACGPDTALAAWYRAHAARAAGDVDTALERFAESLAADPLPLRAPPQADEAVRAVAARTGAPLVDLARILGPLPDGRLFDDTLHPSPSGAAAIARALAPEVRERL